MRKVALVVFALFSASAFAVTGNGTGSSTQVTGNGTGSSVQVTGNGTGSSVQVTGGGTGSSVQVTGNGTGKPAAIDMDACMSGSWYDPANDGSGIQVEVLEDQIVVYHFRPGKWTILQGDEDALSAYGVRSNGRVMNIGSGGFYPIDNDNVVFEFNYVMDHNDRSRPTPWCLRSDCEGIVEMVRLSQPIPCAEDAVEVTGNGTGKPAVTGGGTGKPQVTGGGTGSSVEVTGGGTGSPVTGGGTGSR